MKSRVIKIVPLFALLYILANVGAAELILKDGVKGYVEILDTAGSKVRFLRNKKNVALDKTMIKYIIAGCDTLDYTVPDSPVTKKCSGPSIIQNKKKKITRLVKSWPLKTNTINNSDLLLYHLPFSKQTTFPLYDTLNEYLVSNTSSKLISLNQLQSHINNKDDVVIVLPLDYFYQRNKLQTQNGGAMSGSGRMQPGYTSNRSTSCGKIHYIVINPGKQIRLLDEELEKKREFPFGAIGTIYAEENADLIRKKTMLNVVRMLVKKLKKLQSE